MTPEDWIAAGYRRWETRKLDIHKLADFGLQKRFDDECGKKYFITVYVYDRSMYPNWEKLRQNTERYGFMPCVQFSLRDDKPFFDIDMNGTFNIEECEDWFERLWEFFGKPYYEEWDNA